MSLVDQVRERGERDAQQCFWGTFFFGALKVAKSCGKTAKQVSDDSLTGNLNVESGLL